ncbi:MAG TPA: PAAR domain-containing protein, partial [Candidatus Nanopelagicales bacterium]|nr:PAAR domain-containing protein [Candidatus Nanopelagicales bacterium]
MGAAELKEAARHQEDPIEHSASFLGAVIGAVVGLAIGIAIVAGTVATGGGLLVLLGSLALAAGTAAAFSGLGKDIGKLIGSFIPMNAGDIKQGSPDVTVGSRTLQAARVEDPVKCHEGQRIAEGCVTIYINNKPAARVEQKTECNGKIKEGCPTVKYGGPTGQFLAIKDPDDPAWFFWATEILDWISFAGGVTTLFRKGGMRIVRLLTNPRAWRTAPVRQLAYDVADKFYFVADKYFGGNFGDYINRAGGESPSWLSKWEFTDSTAYQVTKIGWGAFGVSGDVRNAWGRWRNPARSGGPSGGGPSNGAPTGGAPTGGAPTGGAPTGGAPTNGAPTNGAPTNGAP